VHELGGPLLPAIGFAAGEERLLLSLGEEKQFLPVVGPVFFALLGAEARGRGFVLAQSLRRAGIPASLDYAGRSLKAQMKEADRQGAAYVVILGENELARSEVIVRRMSDATQDTIALDRVLPYLQERY
jgi:histidyl-tRNA synthetase